MWGTGCLGSGADTDKAAVVAGYAITVDSLVRRHRRRRHEGIDIVAGIAILAGRHVIDILDQLLRRVGG